MVKCLRNFSCNKVNGFPGKVLSNAEVEEVNSFLPWLLQNELVLIMEKEVHEIIKQEIIDEPKQEESIKKKKKKFE